MADRDREIVADFIDGLDDNTKRKLYLIHTREELEDMPLDDIVNIVEIILSPSNKTKKELKDLRDIFGYGSEEDDEDEENRSLLYGL